MKLKKKITFTTIVMLVLVYCIFFRKSQSGTNLVTSSTLNILDINYFNAFWISWINGVIRVGKGTVVGNDMFMSYNDPSPFAVNYVALSTYITPGSAIFNDGL